MEDQEAFELVLRSNGYEKFNTKDPQKDKGKRYTFITGSESSGKERNISKSILMMKLINMENIFNS